LGDTICHDPNLLDQAIPNEFRLELYAHTQSRGPHLKILVQSLSRLYSHLRCDVGSGPFARHGSTSVIGPGSEQDRTQSKDVNVKNHENEAIKGAIPSISCDRNVVHSSAFAVSVSEKRRADRR